MTAAMLGKLIPYTVLFTMMGIICDLILYDWMRVPMAGSIWNMFLGTFLLVLASEAVAFFIVGTLPVLRLSISISALYSMLAFSLAGFSLPVEAMPPYIQGLSAAFPLRLTSVSSKSIRGFWTLVLTNTSSTATSGRKSRRTVL